MDFDATTPDGIAGRGGRAPSPNGAEPAAAAPGGLELDRLYDGDCLELFRRVGDETVDLIFADPPFNIGYDYDIYDDRRDADEYIQWSRKWISGVIRVLKPTGTFWL